MSKHTTSGTVRSLYAAWAWWRERGEPIALTVLAVLTCTLPLLAVVDALPWRAAMRGMLMLGWLAGMLLALRLPALLRRERVRLAIIAGVGAGAVIFAAVATPGMSLFNNAAPVAAAPANDDMSAPLEMGMCSLESPAQKGVDFNALAIPEHAAAADPTRLTFVAAPRITRAMFGRALARGNGAGPSPVAPIYNEVYDIIVGYGLDPAIALAIFGHESQFGTTGICSTQDAKNWGGNRSGGRQIATIRTTSGPFAKYATWQDGVRDWCELILYRYVRRGLTTVEDALPVYAPSSDGNSPPAYIAKVRAMVAAWRGRNPAPLVYTTPHTYTNGDLQTALLTEMFEAGSVEYHPTWAFHKYAVDETRAGRSLGAPLDESRTITVGGKKYAIQAFALDTLYTPLADIETQTNWGDVRRLSDMIKQAPAAAPTAAPAQPAPAQPTAAPTAAPATTAKPAQPVPQQPLLPTATAKPAP